MSQTLHVELLVLVVSFNHFIPKRFYSSACLVRLLRNLYRHDWHPSDGTTPFVNWLSRIRVGASHLREPTAFKADAVFLNERAKSAGLNLHASVP